MPDAAMILTLSIGFAALAALIAFAAALARQRARQRQQERLSGAFTRAQIIRRRGGNPLHDWN